jgi:septum formation protein
MNSPAIFLASASPRRRTFLQELGLRFAILTADIDETPESGEHPEALVHRLAEAKARAAAARLPAQPGTALVLAADTVVALGKEILGKPANRQEALEMLHRLRRTWHQVHSGIAVLSVPDGRLRIRVNTTRVSMRAYTDAEIQRYLATGDPLDKAGAYAIQHRSFAPVQALDGCAAGVMGLPLAELRLLLAQFGVEIPSTELAQTCARLTGYPCCQSPHLG